MQIFKIIQYYSTDLNQLPQHCKHFGTAQQLQLEKYSTMVGPAKI